MQARTMEIAAVCMSLENLRGYQCVKDAMAGGLKIYGRLLDVRNNEVYSINENEKDIILKPHLHAELPQPKSGGNLAR